MNMDMADMAQKRKRGNYNFGEIFRRIRLLTHRLYYGGCDRASANSTPPGWLKAVLRILFN
jgi:hypothetical protein